MEFEKFTLTIDGRNYRFQEELTANNCIFSLEKLSYDKGIYRPAEMAVTMNVSGDVTYGNLREAFYMKPVSLTVKYKDQKDGQQKEALVAENYFVFKVKPAFRTVSNGSSVKLELTIYSQDKLMTLDKYSRAWSGKKLGADIFTKDIEYFKFNGQTIDTSCDLQIVDYSSNEFIHPYLVQYNESFYDFLKRTANRCGEFLYHENGQLHLGMTVHDTATDDDPDYAKKAKVRYYEDILREGTETSDYAYNYMDDKADPKEKPYSNPLASDEYLNSVSRNYTDWDEQKDYISKNVFGSLWLALQAPTLSAMLSNVAVNLAFKLPKAILAATNLNFKHESVNITPWEKKGDQQGADQSVSQFSTYSDQKPKSGFGNKAVNLNAEFYAMVGEAEKKVSENAVYLEFGDSTQNLAIGDKIKVDGVNYIVIGVNGGCELSSSDGSAKNATPKYEERQQVIGVMLYGDVPIPPAIPGTVIRESQPQLAFVTANFDPEKIGRVRVRFAWQPKEKDEKEKEKEEKEGKKDEKYDGSDSSPWIRVSLPFATNGGGVRFKPEVGDEVIVSFEEGNIERPYVSGYLLSPHSKDNWGYLPDRGIMSKNGHGITFNDNIDGATFIYALFPFLQTIRGFIPNEALGEYAKFFEKNEICTDLAGGMTISDRFGLYKIDLSSTSRSVTIQSSMGNVSLNAFTGINISSPSGDIKIQGKNVSIEASDKVTIESGKAVKQRFLYEKDVYQEDGLEWNVPYQRFWQDLGANLAEGMVKRTIYNLVDVSLMRAALDLLLKPIDGTMRISSTTFVQVEAGKGSAEYPRAARKGDAAQAPYDLMPSLDHVTSTMGTRVVAVKTAYREMYQAYVAFNAISGAEGINPNGGVVSFDDVKAASYKEVKTDLQFHWDQAGLDDIKTNEDLQKKLNDDLNALENEKLNINDKEFKDLSQEAAHIRFEAALKQWEEQRKKICADYQKALNDRDMKVNKRDVIMDIANKLSTAVNLFYKASHGDFCLNAPIDGQFQDQVRVVLEAMTFQHAEGLMNPPLEDKSEGYWNNLRKHYMRLVAYNLLSNADVGNKVNGDFLGLAPTLKALTDLDKDEKWQPVISDLVKDKTWGQKAKIKFKNWNASTYGTINPKADKVRWEMGVEGKILLSDNSETTLSFDKDGVVQKRTNQTFTDKTSEQLRIKLGNIGN